MNGHAPARPTLTIVFMSAIVFWAACALSYATGALRDDAAACAVLAASGALSVGGLALAGFSKTRFAGVILASAAVGAFLGCSQAAFVHASASGFEGVAGKPAEITLLEDSVDYGFGESALVEARVSGKTATFSARFGGCGPLLSGQRVAAEVTFKPVDYSEDGYAWNDGSCGQLACSEPEIIAPPLPLDALISIRARAIEAIGADDERHALLQALVCGYRRNIRGTELYAQFQSCGLAHLVAVSGAHLVIVTGLFASLLKRLRAPRKLVIGLLIAVMLSYYVIAGMPVSALRATIMSALGLFSYFGRRRPSSLNAVGVGLFGIVAVSPTASVSASLALSVLSTVGIVLFGPLVRSWLERTPLAGMGFVLDSLSLTVSASLLSQLYACSLFSQLPLIGPLANVLSAPLFPFACGLGLVAGAGQAALGGLQALGTVAALASGLLVWLVGALARVPFASVPFTLDTATALAVTGAVSAVLWAWWPRSGKDATLAAAMCLAAAVAGFLLPSSLGDRIVMLDVGQGDAILVQSRGQSMLVDTGNKDSMLQRELAANHVAHLDSVLITHADDDHYGSIDQLDRSVDVTRVILARDMLGCEDASARSLVEQAGHAAREVVGVGQGDAFSVGAFRVRVVWPGAFSDDGGNADSLCVVLEYDADGDGGAEHTVLMTGDAEKDELAEMLEAGLVGDVDVLKVGHHGSRNGMTEDEAGALKPEIALISCGLHNRYGHPAPETLRLLDGVGASVFRTDLDGEITCTFSAGKIAVSKEKPGEVDSAAGHD